jgi:hypothetical protein
MFEHYMLIMLFVFSILTIALIVWGVVQTLSAAVQIEKSVEAIQASSRDIHANTERLIRLTDATLETARATLLEVRTQSPMQ